MGIAYHKKTSTKYVQYTLRIEESILDKIKSIAGKEDLSINEVVNQSLQFAINDYEKNIFHYGIRIGNSLRMFGFS